MMRKEQIIKKIGKIIQELQEQQEYFAQEDHISDVELELFTANADFLIDHIEVLKKINGQQESAPVVSTPIPTAIDAESKSQDFFDIERESDDAETKPYFSFSLDEEPKEMVFDFEKQVDIEEVFDRELTDEELALLREKSDQKEVSVIETLPTENIVEMEEVAAPNEEEDEPGSEEEDGPEPFLISTVDEPLTEKQVESEIPGNGSSEFKPVAIEPVKDYELVAISAEKPLTLNELLSSKLGQKNPGTAGKSIDDLKSAISLNDKMIFIKELFNGYNLAYSEAIEIINRFSSFEAADNFLQKNYAKKNDWDSKSGVVERLYDYLNRRFVS